MISADAPPKETVSPRLRVAEVLAFVAVVAALVGALGPAEHRSTTYSWPPRELSEASPSRVWYTPLLLARRFPESLAATLPCSAQPALAAADNPVTVLATARSPERAGGLAVRQEGDRLAVVIGSTFRRHLPLSRERMDAGDCAYRVSIADGRWSVTGGPTGVELADELERMPVVNGLFSALDLKSAGEPPSVDVTTEVHRADPIARQTVAWVVAAFCLVAALLLVSVGRRPERPRRVLSRARALVSRGHAVDAAIAVVLVGWWVLSPVFWDDGWTLARHDAFSSTGGFSNYYDSFGAALPLGYWLEWLQHWITQSTTAILLLRLPALVSLAATWLLVRWILARVLTASPATGSVVLWALGSSFAVGAMAWGMTLRLEPVVAVLVTGAMACTIRFLETPNAAPLAAIAVLVPLAITAHPVGVVALAPLIVVAPTMIRWARSRPASSATIATSAIALLLVLAFVGSDVAQRSTDAQVVRESSDTVVGWRDEIVRYDVFSAVRTVELSGYGTPLRRASVALIVLAILAFAVLRGRRRSTSLDHIPTSALAVALVLLISTPSKWPWHFGALIGLAALAVAAETGRLRSEEQPSSGSTLRPLIAIGAAVLAIAWTWSPQGLWNPLDLRTLEWNRPFDGFPGVGVAIGIPLLALAGVFVARMRRTADSRIGRGWWFASWTVPALLLPMILFTAGFLVADTAATPSWTPTRQSLEGVRGDAGCGLADDLLVPDTQSVRSLPALVWSRARPVPDWVPPAPVPSLLRFTLGPTSEGWARSSWFKLPPHPRIGLYVAGTPGPFDSVSLEWGRLQDGRIQSRGLVLLELPLDSQAEAILGWRLLTAGELRGRARDANAARVILRSDAAPGSAMAFTSPVVYENEPLARRLNGARSLVFPNLRLYLPCVELARFSGGIAEVPSIIVTTSDAATPVRHASSPFAGLLDVYRLERVSLADSEKEPEEVVVFGIDGGIPGGRLAPPIAATR
jgi:Mycobacterial cell wall arabinan synthesis protein/Arabinosyltransferase concanavalin like domain